MGLRRLQSEQLVSMNDGEVLRLLEVDELTHTVLQRVVKLNTDIKTVFPKVADTNRPYRLFVLQYIVDKKPKIQSPRGDDGQSCTSVMVASVTVPHRSYLRHAG